MEKLQVSYSFDYLKEVFNYILVPVFIVLLIVLIGLFIYSRVEKDHTTEHYNYTINFWSYLMCIILSAALFAIALSFVVSLHSSIAGRQVDKTNLIYLVYLSPLIPLAFLVSTGIHWIRMFLSYRENKKEDQNINSEDENTNDDLPQEEIKQDNPFENLQTQEVEKTIDPIPEQTLSAEQEENENSEEPENNVKNDETASNDSEEKVDALENTMPLSDEKIEIPEVKPEPTQEKVEEPQVPEVLENLEEEEKVIPEEKDIEVLDVLEEGDN